MHDNRLFQLIETGNAEELSALLKDAPELVNVRNEAGVSPLLYAYYLRKPELSARLLDESEITLDAFDAAAAGDLECLRELVLADPDCLHDRACDGFSPLHLACFFACAETVSYLLDQGVDANVLGAAPANLRPLHSAVAASNVESARLLLQRGADPNSAQQGGWTPLHAAANHGDLELVQLLLEYGASRSLTADTGKTAAQLASEGGHVEVAARLE